MARVLMALGALAVAFGWGVAAGFLTQVALDKMLPVTREIRALIDAPADEVHQAAVQAGMTTLHQDGVRLCLEGVSSLEEIRRVTGEWLS